MKKTIKRIAALAMALTIAGAGTSVSGVFSANVLTAEAATVSANYLSAYGMKRVEFVQKLYAKAHYPNVKPKSIFSDVPTNYIYAKAITWAYDKGIVSGYPGGTFGVNDTITYEQVIQMIFKYAKYDGSFIIIKPGAANDFKMSQWAKNSGAIDWAVTNDLINTSIVPRDLTSTVSSVKCSVLLDRYKKI
ncbi:S-layer homology domain-containing protein [Ruminococcus albus]|uniref:S-layer homology domain-containing protein n=1 Tax=Ruminococcus albus TaxID=1264 RepID=UPI0004667BE3|nr:S-layer homology domain-containing protein [Ruminococcus albus]